MNIIPVKTPNLVKHVLPSLVWNIETTEKVIYLTFDDGPTPEITDWVLKTLDVFNAKATFFCIGNNIKENPEIFKNIIYSQISRSTCICRVIIYVCPVRYSKKSILCY